MTRIARIRRLERRAGTEKHQTFEGLSDPELNFLLVRRADKLIEGLRSGGEQVPSWLDDFAEASRRNPMIEVSKERYDLIIAASKSSRPVPETDAEWWELIKEAFGSGPIRQLPTPEHYYPNAAGDEYLRVKYGGPKVQILPGDVIQNEVRT